MNNEVLVGLQHKIDKLQAALNESAGKWARAELYARELEAKLDAYDETHMLLPVDADGVPIRVGDFLECYANGYDGKFEVFAVGDGVVVGNHDIGFVVDNPVNWFHVAKYCLHVKPRTIENVLEEFIAAYDEWDDNCHDDREKQRQAVFDKYADELRWLGVDDDR